MQVGLFLLVILMAFVIFNDISRIVGLSRLLAAGAPAARSWASIPAVTIASLGLVARWPSRRRASASGHIARRGSPGAVDELLGAAGITIRRSGGDRGRNRSRFVYWASVGLSYAKGLVLALRMRTCWRSLLRRDGAVRAVRQPSTSRGRRSAPILDARKGEVYASLYRVVADAARED